MDANANPYETLGVAETATQEEIKKAYKKKALLYHPDKSTGNEELFRKIVQAHGLLTDEKAKAAFDNVLKTRHANKMREDKLDAEQKKARMDLAERERQHKERQKVPDVNSQAARKAYEAELVRLREENEARILAEQERLRKEAMEAMDEGEDYVSSSTQEELVLKVKWSTSSKSGDKSERGDANDENSSSSSQSNGGYTRENLINIFKKYGPMDVVMSRKPGKALVHFRHLQDAHTALCYEQGLPSNPFKRISIDTPASPAHSEREGSPASTSSRSRRARSVSPMDTSSSSAGYGSRAPVAGQGITSAAAASGSSAAAFLTVTEDEFNAYEARVLQKLRDAQAQRV